MTRPWLKSVGRWPLLLGFFLLCLLGSQLLLGSAQASLQDQLLPCSSLSKAVERDDQTIVAIGETYRCDRGESGGWKFLVGVSSSGDVLPGFGQGGIVRLPDGSGTTLLERQNGGLIVRSENELIAYRSDGRRDRSFGSDGVLIRPDMRSARIGPDGKLYVLWVDRVRRIYERFTMEGATDSTFGNQGQIQIDLPFSTDVTPVVDSEGRIYLVDYRTVIRLLPDGSPDTEFGSDGNGKVELDVNPAPSGFYFPYGVSAMEIGSDGNFYAYGRGNYDLYIHPSFLTGLDPSGEALPNLPRLFDTYDIGSVSLFDGGAAFNVPDGRWDTTSPMRIGAEAWPSPVTAFFTAGQYPAQANGTTPLANGSLLAVGSTVGSVCAGKRCGYPQRMALLKVQADGSLDTGFGERGKVVLPGNQCEWGRVRGEGDWDSCRLRPPRIRGSVSLYGAKSRRPRLRVQIQLGPVPVRLGEEGHQILAFTLPRWLKVRSAGLLRRSVARSTPKETVALDVTGRRIKATVQDSRPLRIWLGLRPGSIELTRASEPVDNRRIRLRATFIPYANSTDSPGRSSARLPVELVGDR